MRPGSDDDLNAWLVNFANGKVRRQRRPAPDSTLRLVRAGRMSGARRRGAAMSDPLRNLMTRARRRRRPDFRRPPDPLGRVGAVAAGPGPWC